MKAKSNWLAIFLALGLVLAACGDGAADETTTTAGEAATTEAETDTTEATDTTAGEEPMDIATDIGVDLDAETITVGMLSDLTGQFSSLVQVIVTGHEVYWDNVNANGGINGLQVELAIEDTGYIVDNHVQKYEQLKDEVVAFGHSTGSPHTVQIVPDLQADGILAIPLTWYSGWTTDDLGSNLLHHGMPYCLEAMNVMGYITDNNAGIETVAIASQPGDYGLDSMEGAKLAADALGLEIVYDGSGVINPLPGGEATRTEVANAIAGADPDLVWVTTGPTAFSEIFAQAVGQTDAVWSGAGPSYNPAFIAPESGIKDAIAARTIWGGYYAQWGTDNPGTQEAVQLLLDSGRVDRPISAYLEGFVEARMMHAALEAAYDAGDMTQAGVLAAAKSLEDLDLNGLGPNESYVGTSDEQVQRASFIWRPDPDSLASGANAGEETLETDYTHPIVEAFEFNEPCYVLEG